jgi:(2R)-3-sulfolactate dehydrogenase (NADP+)
VFKDNLMPIVSIEEMNRLVARAIERSGASTDQARAAARFLVTAEAQGLSSHGLSRTPLYCAHLKNGRTDGQAVPALVREKAAACLVDAGFGMAFAACALAVAETVRRAREYGVAFAGVTNSNHFGVAALHLVPVAEAGMVGLAFGNSPAAMAVWGGRTPLFGTNPIAAIFPRRGHAPLVIDLSLSEVARGKILVASQQGKSIPQGWALDREGRPTTDPKAALQGSMLPAGGVKGAMLALVVELLCCALTGAAFGFEADSFFTDAGNRPRIGQAFVAIDPAALAGNDVYQQRLETLIAAMLADDGVRLPGERRLRNAAKARAEGLTVPEALYQTISELAQGSGSAPTAG